MSLKQVRDSKDPMPKADNSFRSGGDGNVPVAGNQEGHNAGKAERIKEDARFTLRTGGERQPTREGGDGNVPITDDRGEKHNQPKAERITEKQRGFDLQ
jgi:hypothetical protein